MELHVSDYVQIICIFSVLGYMAGELFGQFPLKAVAKTSASVAFVLHAYYRGSMLYLHSQYILAGLVFGAVGDLLLLSRSKPTFMLGIFAFFVNDVFFVMSFWQIGFSRDSFLVWLPVTATGGFTVWIWLRNRVGSLRIPVIAYIFVITLAVTASLAAAWEKQSPARWCLVTAMLVFFVSDLLVARDRFVKRSHVLAALNAPLYFGSQLLFGGCGCSTYINGVA